MPKNLVPNQFDYSGIYVEGERSQFRFNKGVQDSFMSGMLVPLGDPIRVFPGTKLDLKVSANIISNTMVAVPLNGIYVDFFAVWVPDRIVWTHQPQFLGENDETAWTQSSNYVYPYETLANLNNSLHTLLSDSDAVADESVTAGNLFLSPHYGLFYGNTLPSTGPAFSQKINMLSYRGYYASWNHLFRDENYQRPVLFSKSDTGSSGEFGYYLLNYDTNPTGNIGIAEWFEPIMGEGVSDKFAMLMPVNKFHDARTSLLPQPQYGNSVGLGVGLTAPILSKNELSSTITFDHYAPKTSYSFTTGQSREMRMFNSSVDVGPVYADLSGALGTINQFRANVMTQRFLEALARGGRRVPELYESIWSVKNTVARYDYPELLSHERYVLSTQQVVATADGEGSDWTSHLGDRGAYSLTVLRDIPICQKDFTEFGYLHILYCVRSTNQYSQFIPEHFTRSVLLDEYNPYFDHIGDVGMPSQLVNVLCSTGANFGYQEAWWFERTEENMTLSALNKLYGSLSYHVIGQKFGAGVNTCTPAYLCFDPGCFKETFISDYSVYPQFLIDANIHGKKVARMSQHSIPGIVGRI